MRRWVGRSESRLISGAQTTEMTTCITLKATQTWSWVRLASIAPTRRTVEFLTVSLSLRVLLLLLLLLVVVDLVWWWWWGVFDFFFSIAACEDDVRVASSQTSLQKVIISIPSCCVRRSLHLQRGHWTRSRVQTPHHRSFTMLTLAASVIYSLFIFFAH